MKYSSHWQARRADYLKRKGEMWKRGDKRYAEEKKRHPDSETESKVKSKEERLVRQIVTAVVKKKKHDPTCETSTKNVREG